MCSNSRKPEPEDLKLWARKDLDNQSGYSLARGAVLADYATQPAEMISGDQT